MKNDRYLDYVRSSEPLATRTAFTRMSTLLPEKPETQEIDTQRFIHGVSVIVSEAGKLLGMTTAFLFRGHTFNRTNAIEKLGGVLWGMTVACDALSANIDDICQQDLTKLRKKQS